MSSMIDWVLGQLRRTRDTRITGYLGEVLVMELLRATVWQVYQPVANKVGDLICTNKTTGEVLRVEVKIARRGYRGYWQFRLFKADRHGVTDCRHADVVVLLCIDGENMVYPYVIPQKFLGDRAMVVITSHPTKYSGRLADYRQEMGALDLDSGAMNEMAAAYYGYDEVLHQVV